MTRVARFIAFALTLPIVALGCVQEEEEPPVYQMIPVTTRDIVVSANAAGTVEPVLTVEVKSKASGEILDVRVETGDKVEAGRLLVKVDPRVPANALRQAEADLEVAKAQLTNAESQYRRSQELFKTQSITETEWEGAILAKANAEAQLVRAERSVEDARIAFEDTDVRAPITGTVLEKAIEIGTVITSATSNVSGGAVLMRMANLDTVQVRSLVDETDIGKIKPGMNVTITVDAYPNRPFQGRVLKVEPQATVVQNVTMFPVLMRIANEDDLLRPGMNAEVEVSIGQQRGVLAVPNAALRTTNDVGSAAAVLGLDQTLVREQLAAAREQQRDDGGQATMAASVRDPQRPERETVTLRGREVPVPDGLTKAEIEVVLAKMQGGGGFSALSEADRRILGRLRNAGGGQGGRDGGRGSRTASQSSTVGLFGGNYVVFLMRGGEISAVPVQTGLTDLDYSEVISGLTAADTVLVLPSASLLRSQAEFSERVQRMTGRNNPLGGTRR
jgi:HlyD family secretion protein